MEGVAPSNSNSTANAQIELANLPPEELMEGLFLPKELTNPETLFPSNSFPKGFLMMEGKYYGMKQEESTQFSQKLQETVKEHSQLKETKTFDPKESVKEHKFTEKHVREKEVKTQKTEHSETRFERKESKEQKTLEKTHEFAEKIWKETKETGKPQTLQTFIQKVFHREAPHENKFQKQEKKEETEKPRPESQARPFEKGDNGVRETNKHVEKQKDQEKEKEREGFAEDQKKNNQEDEREQNNKDSCQKVTFEKEFATYGNQDSFIMSEILKMRVSQFDVILLFLEIMKLAIRGREQERIARWQEREYQLFHMQKVVDNFKQQGKYQLFAGLGSGIFAIVSGLCPIVGHLKGPWIRDKFSYFFTSLKNMDPDKLFKSIQKITYSMSEMQKSTGQIQGSFAESSRTFDQHMMELHKTDGDENTRTMEDIKDHWKNIENFVYQSLQMYHEAIRQLYN